MPLSRFCVSGRTITLLAGLVFFELIWSVVPAHSQGNRFALLIGNSRYEHATPLRNPENDIGVLEKALKTAGFETFSHANLDSKSMRTAIGRFVRRVKRHDDPVLVFYFSGHGVALNGQNYLLPVDAKVASPDELRKAALSFQAVHRFIAAIDPKLQILILDACRDTPFDNLKRNLTKGLALIDAEQVGRKSKETSTVLAFSTNPGNVALDGDTGTSPYAGALAEAILLPGLKLEEVFKRVRRTVKERTKGVQEPWENVSLYDDFYFHPKAQDGVVDQLDLEFWELASLVDSIESMKRYLDKFPNGLFATLARQRMENMQRDFAYTRKAEVFPIIRLRGANFDPCKFWKDTSLFQFYELRTKYKDRIVYLDVELPFERSSCDYLHVDSQLSGGGGYQVFPGSRARLSESRRNSAIADAKSLARNLGVTQWGHGIFTAYTRLFFPAGGEHYSAYDHCEASCLFFKGLVRVRDYDGEEILNVYFEQVDPAEVGLTWKFENTKQAAVETDQTD